MLVSMPNKKAQVKKVIQKKSVKKHYKVRNWKEYNESLVNRGSLEFWIEQGIRVKIEITDETGKIRRIGRPKLYSDAVVNFALTLGDGFSPAP